MCGSPNIFKTLFSTLIHWSVPIVLDSIQYFFVQKELAVFGDIDIFYIAWVL